MVSRPGIGSWTTRTPFSRVWRVVDVVVPTHIAGRRDGGASAAKRSRSSPLAGEGGREGPGGGGRAGLSDRASNPSSDLASRGHVLPQGENEKRSARRELPHEGLHRLRVGRQAVKLLGLLRQVRRGARGGRDDAGGGRDGFGELGRVGGGQHHHRGRAGRPGAGPWRRRRRRRCADR